MVTDIISDTLARLKNAISRGHDTVNILKSKSTLSLMESLKKEDFIVDFAEEDGELVVELKYDNNGNPLVENFVRVSKPGQRIYVTKKEILPVMNGRGISLISTSKGVMTGAQAKSMDLGGEYICKIW